MVPPQYFKWKWDIVAILLHPDKIATLATSQPPFIGNAHWKSVIVNLDVAALS
jgi:hypothetical protein